MINIRDYFRDYFKKDGDDFVVKLIEIVDNEKIKIEQVQGSVTKFSVDDHKYMTEISEANGCNLQIYDSNGLKCKINISRKYYYWFYKKQQKQEQEKHIYNLPDLSEVGRNAKKYNL